MFHQCVKLQCRYWRFYGRPWLTFTDITTHLVPGGVVLDRVLRCQTDAAEQDEEEDEVGEDVVVDDLMAQNPESEGKREKEKKRVSCSSFSPWK